MKTIFKVGDKVFSYNYGWGEVHSVSTGYLKYFVYFEMGSYWCSEKELSFTEYTLQGFSQERPKKEPEIGSLCLFSDYESDIIKNLGYTGHLHEIQNTDFPYLKRDGKWFKFCKQIKIEEV